MKLVVLDIDGTLTDSIALHVQSFLQAFSAVRITDIDTNWNGYTHHTDSWIFAEVFRRSRGRDPNADEGAAFETKLHEYFAVNVDAREFREIAGARLFVERLQSNETTAVVFATGSFRQPAIRKLELIGLQVPQQLLVTASEFETREDIIRNAIVAAAAYYKVGEFERIISIGDGHWDLVAARNLGLDFIGICTGAAADKMKLEGALKIFPNLVEVSIDTL